MRAWLSQRRKRRDCRHHEVLLAATRDARSLLRSRLIETGKARMEWCAEDLGGCGKVWIT